MVREQESPRYPLLPSVANAAAPSQTMSSQGTGFPASPKAVAHDLSEENFPSPQPVFGRPTQLGAPSQFLIRGPQAQRSDSGGSRVPSQNRGPDGHNHMFIKNTSGNRRPEFHKPPAAFNPLQSLHRPPVGGNPLMQMNKGSEKSRDGSVHTDLGQYRQRPARVIDSSDEDDDNDGDVFKIPKPTGVPTWQPKPFTHPTFSSSQFTNPYSQPKAPTTTFMNRNTLAANTVADGGIWEDRYNAADPSIYLDSGKANEELKALFEGSVEDEDDKPKSKRKPKQPNAKTGDLADQLKSLDVKPGADLIEEQDEGEDDDGTVDGLKVKLLPHQIEGVEWMKTKERGSGKGKGMTKGGILADDMGLGKTIQSIALILTNKPPTTTEKKSEKKSEDEIVYDKCTLIVAPLALIKQWEGELQDRIESSHSLKVCVHHGPQRAKSFKELRKYDIIITTYQTLSSEHAACSDKIRAGCYGINWYRVILDEAHSIKNRNAKVTKAACALEAQYRWCLTGTPMQNHLDELQSLIQFLRIGPLDKFDYWKSRIIQPINSGRGGLAIKRLQTALKGIMKRRTKDVLKQSGALKEESTNESDKSNDQGFKIVKRTVEKIEAEFTAEERSFYFRLESRIDRNLEQMRAGNKAVSYASALVLLLRLRQACNHVKLLGFDLAGERDALGDGSQSPRKKTSDNVDDLAAMLGGLNVETKQCDICQVDLTAQEIEKGVLRCHDCEEDLNGQIKRSKTKTKQRKKETQAIVKNDRRIKRRVIVDSDDEEEDGQGQSMSKIQSKTVDLANVSDDEYDDSNDNDEDDGEDDDDNDSTFSSSSCSEPDFVASTKIRHLLSILRNDCHTHKYIVFSFFTSMLDLIEPFLRQHHIKFVRYDGSMRNDAREASLHSLRHDPTTRVLLCSLRAGSLGLNLTAASRVVVLEPFWNPFVEEQAIDRVHRLNQTQDVVVYKLTIKDTVEARILELQERKRELARVTVESGDAGKHGLAKLSLAEMMKLFEHSTEHAAMLDMLGMRDSRSLFDRNDRRSGDRTDIDGDVDHDGDRDPFASETNSEAKSRPWDPISSSFPTMSQIYTNKNGARNNNNKKVWMKKDKKEHEVYGRRW